MTSVLIVDDELHAVQGIKSAIDWGKLGVTDLYTAYNIEQAKECFTGQGPIDVMLCDIEMPMGTGLELLAWVKEHASDTESIFLTCHADFNYAKQAVQLGSFDYLLKPVPIPELEDVIGKAIQKKAEHTEKSKFSQYGQYWVQHQPFVIERFWLDLLNRTIPSQREAIKQAAEERNIIFTEHKKYLPVWFVVKQWHKELNARDEKILEYAFRNAAEEVLLSDYDYGQLLSWSRGGLFAILSVDAWSERESGRLKQQCEQLIDLCRQYFYCEMSCYIAYPEYPEKLPAISDELRMLDRNNVTFEKVMLLHGGQPAPDKPSAAPELLKWSILLQDNQSEKLCHEIAQYLDLMVKQGNVNASALHQFHQDLLQMIYSFLHGKGIHAHRLFSDEQSVEKAGNAVRSVKETLSWCIFIVHKAIEHVQASSRTETVVDRVRAYILQHLDNELTREEIAKSIFLNPDYLDRMFKKNVGLTVTEYVLEQRLQMAKHLLCHTSLPVSAIATQVGITNFSYFSRIFKKNMNQNPLEYRQSCLKTD